MIKLSHKTLVIISGIIWLTVGLGLCRLGATLLMGALGSHFGDELAASYPLVARLASIAGGVQEATALLLVIAMVVGYFKGRFVLGKSARRGVARIMTFPNPTSLGNLYSPQYYLLLGGMVCLGISIKYLGIPLDVRGAIDVAIGFALVAGAQIYFRSLLMVGRAS